MTFEDILRSAFANVGPRIVADMLAKKLRDQGVRVSRGDKARIAGAFSRSTRGDTLRLRLGDPASQNRRITLRFTTADLEEFERKAQRFVERMPSLYRAIIEDEAPRFLRLLIRRWSQEERQQKRHRDAFEKRLRRRWGKPLGRLHLALTIARETADVVADALRSVKSINTPHTIDVVTRLHARACQVGYEVLTLLSSGFADGAMARWRTLHEIAITAMFIQQQGDVVAERYALHQIVESRKAAHQHQQYAGRIGERPLTAKQMAAIERQYVAVVDRFGKSFKEEYGWAADTLANPNPKFSHIEAGVKVDHWRPYYKLASYNVHANSKGIYFRLGLIKKANLLAVGPTNYGLTDPGQNTALSLLLMTVALVQLHPTVDGLVALKVLSQLQDEIGELFVRTQKGVEADARQYQRRSRGRDAAFIAGDRAAPRRRE